MQFIYNFWKFRNYLIYVQSTTELSKNILNSFIEYLGDDIRYDFIQQTDTPEYYNRHTNCFTWKFYSNNNCNTLLTIKSSVILDTKFLCEIKKLIYNCCGYGFCTNNITIQQLTDMGLLEFN